MPKAALLASWLITSLPAKELEPDGNEANCEPLSLWETGPVEVPFVMAEAVSEKAASKKREIMFFTDFILAARAVLSKIMEF